VEVVLQAAADVSSREQKTVNLQISVGDADLNVRVELHANEVRATFRTDSPELRAALSHEWQSAATISTNGDRTLRIVPAVFNASEHSALNAFAGDTSSRERNQQARRDANERSAKAISIGQRSVVVPPRAVGSAHVASLTSRRLQTVA
jgi:hypothetical protein